MKHTLKFMIILLVIYFWLPIGVSDVWLTPILVGIFGLQLYLIICVVGVLWLWKTIPGKTLTQKFGAVKSEIKWLINKYT